MSPAQLKRELVHRNECLRRYAGIANLLATCATLMEAPVTRFGKPEYHSDEARAAREEIRELAVLYKVGPCDTVLHQAAKVARAILDNVQP